MRRDEDTAREAPRPLVEQLEAAPLLPAGAEERFNGYGVMGLPFTSGHILALRRFPVSSVGPGYTSAWHRTPTGEWVFYATASPPVSCPRFFGVLASDSIQTEISVTWSAPFRFRVSVPAVSLEWDVGVGPTAATPYYSFTHSCPSRSARSQLWYSNSVSSPVRRPVCRSGPDSRSSSCAGGTPRRRSGVAPQ
jgi:hypothetical protein